MAQSATNDEASRPKNVFLFRTGIMNCFKNISESVSADEFVNTLPMLKSSLSLSTKLHKVLKKNLYAGMCADLEELFNEESFTKALAEASKLMEESSRRPDEIAWRPPGDVKLHLRNLDAEKLREGNKNLRKKVEEMETMNEDLKKTILERRKSVRITEEKIERAKKVATIAIPRLKDTIRQLQDLHDMIDDKNM